MSKSASIYFFTGDFADVLKRHDEGMDQIYATHDEVAKLTKDLADDGVELTIYSFMTNGAREDRPVDGLRIVSLGATRFDQGDLLRKAVAQDRSKTIVAHFPSISLLRSVIASRNNRAMAVLANSYRTKGIGAWIERKQVGRLLNNPRWELVSDHCIPAASQLASMGVPSERLIPWNIPLRFHPKDSPTKTLRSAGQFKAAYAGGIRANKGVADLIRAVAELNCRGLIVHCSLAGGGEIEQMKALGEKLGISDQLSFLGLLPNSEVFELFRTADVVAVPSQPDCTEGFPLTMFEAIASRTPIVCSAHPMFVPVMKDGDTAAVFPPGKPKAFADAMQRVLTDPELYARLSRNADASWAALEGPADWRTMIREYILNGASSPWLAQHTLDHIERAKG
jgi:glycosyltransferase involved in cell wall biosynthesis